jgi:hypothetical protein
VKFPVSSIGCGYASGWRSQRATTADRKYPFCWLFTGVDTSKTPRECRG